MIPAIQATMVHGLQTDEGRAQHLPSLLHFSTFDGLPPPFASPSTIRLEINNAQPQADHRCPRPYSITSATILHVRKHLKFPSFRRIGTNC